MRIVLLVAFAITLSACGQKGDLYLPTKTPPTPAATAATEAVLDMPAKIDVPAKTDTPAKAVKP
jgi:predicted small lipoprotein YifL